MLTALCVGVGGGVVIVVEARRLVAAKSQSQSQWSQRQKKRLAWTGGIGLLVRLDEAVSNY